MIEQTYPIHIKYSIILIYIYLSFIRWKVIKSNSKILIRLSMNLFVGCSDITNSFLTTNKPPLSPWVNNLIRIKVSHKRSMKSYNINVTHEKRNKGRVHKENTQNRLNKLFMIPTLFSYKELPTSQYLSEQEGQSKN